MNISKYRAVLTVVELGSITHAADVLGYTQSGLSYIVKSMEEELGVPLFSRGKNGLTLTPAGAQLLGPLRAISAEEDRLRQQAEGIRGLVTGTLRLGTFCSVTANWLPEILRRFSTDHPGVSFDLVDDDYEPIERMVADGQLTCAFLPKPNSPALRFLPLVQDRYRAVLPLGHPAQDAEVYRLEDLPSEDFILPREGLRYDLGRILRQAQVRPNVRVRAMDSFGAVSLVRAGLGMTILTEACLQTHDQHAFRVLPLDRDCVRSLGIATKTDEQPGRVLTVFLSYVRAWAGLDP